VKDLDQDQLGLTCAACHTDEVTSPARPGASTGAPTDADTWAFLRDLGTHAAGNRGVAVRRSLQALRGQGDGAHARARRQLYADLKKVSEYFTKFVDSSRTPIPWGRARIDAFGMIFNRATGIDLDRLEQHRAANAPVSVPFLWDTHWHDVVQWNGSAPNILAFQRLGRNVGEVLGVFAQRRTSQSRAAARASRRRRGV
jgi:hypothetical protein